METLVELLYDDRHRPDRPAVADAEQALDYGPFIDRVARLAGALASAGVGSGDRVGVHLRKSIDSMVAVHGLLRAGAVHVPLDRSSPSGHTADLVRDCGIEVVISDGTERQLSELAALSDLRVVIGPADVGDIPVRSVSWAAVAEHDPMPPASVDGADSAYVIYTSGSTGRPKGIVHTHASALAYAELAAATYGLQETDRLTNVAPLHFDQSTFELYAAPLAGSSVLVVPDPILRFPASITELMERERVTVWYSVPWLLVQLLRRGALDQRDLSSLRWVLFGGEVFAPGLLAELMGRWPHARFSNVYGPAEVNQCTYFHLDEPPAADEPIPIGQPWADTELKIVDPAGETVEPGTQGELLVRTATAMSEYWGQSDATSAAFRNGGWYATGDLVVERPDANLVFMGRADHQVKVRGHRVEIEAVEAVLADLEGVDEAAVVVRGDELIALVVAEPALDARHVVASLQARLPPYAVPTGVVSVPGLPRTASGKIDHHRARDLLDRTP